MDPDVVEAAALAHDLGHPPFGHLGETTLNKCVREHSEGKLDGYEGNAQAFRIITTLAVKDKEYEKYPGLNLTAATLAATLKYPWVWSADPASKGSKKWGAYHSEDADFRFATSLMAGTTRRSLEADIMDWADDLAYSVHDLEDFHRAGMIPWHFLLHDPAEHNALWEQAESLLLKEQPSTPRPRDTVKRAWDNVRGQLEFMLRPYRGAADDRASLRVWTSALISDLVGRIRVDGTNDADITIEVETEALARVSLLKCIVRRYVIESPALAAQQLGQQRLIEGLFKVLLNMLGPNGRRAAFPIRYDHLIEDSLDSRVRIVADTIASMTEAEAIAFWNRLTGTSVGSVIDPIVR